MNANENKMVSLNTEIDTEMNLDELYVELSDREELACFLKGCVIDIGMCIINL